MTLAEAATTLTDDLLAIVAAWACLGLRRRSLPRDRMAHAWAGAWHRLTHSSAAAWVAVSVVFGIVGALVQRTEIVWSRYFNTNDLFHLFQIAATWCFYLGARQVLAERPAREQPSIASTSALDPA